MTDIIDVGTFAAVKYESNGGWHEIIVLQHLGSSSYVVSNHRGELAVQELMAPPLDEFVVGTDSVPRPIDLLIDAPAEAVDNISHAA